MNGVYMSIFAIADLHLPGHNDKPMNVFGSQWDRHFETISENWISLIKQEDIVLIPGDISWAMQLADAQDDLRSIASLPGRKILLRGNHDYWWSAISKVRSILPPFMYALQNDAVVLDDYVFCGSRGWNLPTEQGPADEQDVKIFQRELLRLEMSLENAKKKAAGKKLIALLHFPPVLADGKDTEVSDLLEKFSVETVVYGHLHGVGIKNGFSGVKKGVEYFLVSCDALEFSPQRIK